MTTEDRLKARIQKLAEECEAKDRKIERLKRERRRLAHCLDRELARTPSVPLRGEVR